MTLSVQKINAALKKLNYKKPVTKQKIKTKTLTHDRLKEIFSYDPETGIFKRKISCHGAKFGTVGGSKKNGYLSMMIDGREYFLHRLAWFYTHGYFPENVIDHINRIKTDNRIENLREVSKSCNRQNSKRCVNNISGVTGVRWVKARINWRVQIQSNNKSYDLGSFKDYDEAVCTRLAAEQCLDWNDCDSTSPAYQYVQEHITKKGACNEDDRL